MPWVYVIVGHILSVGSGNGLLQRYTSNRITILMSRSIPIDNLENANPFLLILH